MVLTNDEKSKLLIFNNIPLNRIQVNSILGRDISNNEWLTYQNKPIKKHKISESKKLKNKFKSIAKEAAIVALKRI